MKHKAHTKKKSPQKKVLPDHSTPEGTWERPTALEDGPNMGHRTHRMNVRNRLYRRRLGDLG